MCCEDVVGTALGGENLMVGRQVRGVFRLNRRRSHRRRFHSKQIVYSENEIYSPQLHAQYNATKRWVSLNTQQLTIDTKTPHLGTQNNTTTFPKHSEQKKCHTDSTTTKIEKPLLFTFVEQSYYFIIPESLFCISIMM
jgi:hypothetical protein